MKDEKDKKTTELFRSGSALRQERFRENQEKAGKKQRLFWLSDSDFLAVKNYVKQLEIAKITAES